MASDNLMTMEQQLPWIFRSTLTDPWVAEAFARDTETLTKAFQKSIPDTDTFNPFHYQPEATTTTTTQVQTPTPTVSGGSESETAASKRRKTTGVGVINGGKVTKRKSRASKRTATTFIAADPAHFRQMVQQVTGVRFGGDRQLPIVPVLKPEPQRRPVNNVVQTGFLPTLDTSAFLLDQPVSEPPMSLASALVAQPPENVSVPPPPPSQPAMADNGGSPGGFDYLFSSFPILESNVI